MAHEPEQLNFLHIPLDGETWFETTGHKVFPDGTRFLVIQDRGDYYLCWKEGQTPPPGVNGSIILKRYCKAIE